mmetsp:Transcript_956/g.1881  ORF Transcript_956/g.1881 Transcript_956/m.1881 type:complete len:669 (-) Transcript_956:38-2044(-)
MEDFGGVDFTSYNMVVVPYCTQDVHIGDAVKYYNDGDDDGSMTVMHHGAHNLYQTLRWIFKNFKHPSQIFLTGCSAGGTAVPTAYHLLNKHYNSPVRAGVRSVHIHSILDSPVYLTPSYFLQNYYNNWNPSVMMKLLGFNFKKYMYDEEYSTQLWNHILRKGSSNDKWGLVTHQTDPVSIFYWETMQGNYNSDYENYDDDSATDWYATFYQSIATVQKKHHNVKSFIMNSEDGHCSFGLYYALQYSEFDSWATWVLRERPVLGRVRASTTLFFTSMFLGLGLLLQGRQSRLKKQNVASDNLLEDENVPDAHKTSFLARHPLTIAYAVFVTFYFFSMLLVGGFTHPLNNPSLGPSSQILNTFGMNNPTFIVYHKSFWRILSSSFLCSGVLTLILVLLSLFRSIRKVETYMNKALHFSIACLIIIIGSNLVFAWFGSGATCSSIALILGLQTFSCRMSSLIGGSSTYRASWCGTIFTFLIASLIFPFNSWLVMIAGMFIGYFLVPYVFHWRSFHDDISMVLDYYRCKKVMAVYAFLVLILLCGARKPNKLYEYPYRTGCNMVYTTEVNNIINSYSDVSMNGGEERKLNANDDNYNDDGGQNNNYDMCAQICIPQLVYYPVLYGINQYLDFSLQTGLCEDNGYEDFFLLKTFNYASITLDAEIYYQSRYYN